MEKQIEDKLIQQVDSQYLRRLNIWAWYINGARTMLLKLREHLLCEEPHQYDARNVTKDDKVINKATLDLIISSKENVDRFLSEAYEIRITDHKLDKKGNLISCRAYFAKKVIKYEEIK